MSIKVSTLVGAGLVLTTLAMPASAREGGGGGDREPAGGAFMTSYPARDSSGVQNAGPPISADVPRSGTEPAARSPDRYAPPQRRSGR